MTEKPERDDFLPKLRNELNGFSPTPVCWAVLSAGKEMNEQLGHLTDWVNWLVDRCALDHRTVPPCWDAYGAVLDELAVAAHPVVRQHRLERQKPVWTGDRNPPKRLNGDSAPAPSTGIHPLPWADVAVRVRSQGKRHGHQDR